MEKKIVEIVQEVNNSELSLVKSSIIKIVEMINDPNTTAKSLRDIIELDPVLSAKVLRMANSAFYGGRGNIDDIKKAITWVGFNQVKELALGLQVKQLFHGDVNLDDYSRTALWKHCVGVGLIAKGIARKEFRMRGENLYTLGLFHDLGIIIEEIFMIDQFKEVYEDIKESYTSIDIIENEVLGFNHTQVGTAVLRSWNFPESILLPILYHHEPLDCPEEDKTNALILYVADYIAQKNDIGLMHDMELDEEYFNIVLEFLGISSEAIEFILEDVFKDIQALENEGWF